VQVTGPEPAAGLGEVGPAQTRRVLRPEHQIDPATEWIDVDQHRLETAARTCYRESRREHGRAGTAAPAGNTHHHSVSVGTLGGVGKPLYQPGLGVGQEDDLLRTEQNAAPPHAGVV